MTSGAGIRFTHRNGASGKKYLPETMGSGAAFFDADGDGWQDLLLANSTSLPGGSRSRSVSALYRNNNNGTFSNVTAGSGLDVEMYGMGIAAADYDNDGRADVYVTALDGNRLFRGLGGGKFIDVTERAGVRGGGFSTCAAWLDFDADGSLDLFVCRYVDWSVEKDVFCTLDGKRKSYCRPESYTGLSPILFRNKGDGTFEDGTESAGLHDPASKALGVALLDYDTDGRVDLFVANDTQPNRLYRNRGNGTFVDVGVSSGVAFNKGGAAGAGMGTDAADYNGSGRPSLIIGNLSNEMVSLYANQGKGVFIDEARTSPIGRSSRLTLTFGCFFFDYDLDGRLDIFAANGHVADDIQRVQPGVSHAQLPHLFRNVGGRFEEVAVRSGAALAIPMVARGAAYADYDADGDLDVVVTTNNGPARLLRNNASSSRAIRLVLRGSTSNRDAIGARVTIRGMDGGTQWRMIKTGSSYLSQSELSATFGLGSANSTNAIEVAWPNGRVEVLGGEKAGQTVTITEGRGVTSRIPFSR